MTTPPRNGLLRLLAERGWTDAELARRAGLDRAHVNLLKNGRVAPTVGTALALAHAFAMPVRTVFPPGSAGWRAARPRGR